MTKTLYLIDGHNVAYRAYFALPPNMRTKDGVPTNATFGFASILLNIILDKKPDSIAVAFDLKEPTFRHILYPEYKAHRPEPDAEFIVQIPYIKKVVETLAIPILELPGYEADDIIGTMAKKAEAAGYNVVIVTGDMDCLQLVSDNISVMANSKGIADVIIYTPALVKQKYGLEPWQIIDYKSLKGDPSDNIPGVMGVGDKTAVKLLTQYQSLDNILKNLGSITPVGLQKKLQDNVKDAQLSYQLATINTATPVNIDPDNLTTNINWEQTQKLFTELQFTSLLKRIPSAEPEEKKISGDYQIITTLQLLEKLKKSMLSAKAFSFDTETTGLSYFEADIVGISFCTQAGAAAYIPFPHIEYQAQQQGLFGQMSAPAPKKNSSGLTRQHIVDVLRDIFASNCIKIAHNIKFDMLMLQTIGIKVNGPIFDTLIADYLIEPTRSHHNLKFLSDYYFGLTMTTLADLTGKGKNQVTLGQVPTEEVAAYCCADSDMAFRLYKLLEKKLQEQGLLNFYNNIEVPLIPVLADMEISGIKLNKEHLKKLSAELDEIIQKEEENIYIIAGQHFNLNSPQQMGEILFNKLGLPTGKKTQTGFSTDSHVLESLEEYEVVRRIMTWRQYTKLKNTYVDVLPELVEHKTSKIHTTFNQAVTATGRLSSTNPNLQNIPIKTEIGSKIRTAFIPSSENFVIVTADYAQIELRVLAELSGDPVLNEAFAKGADIHTATASTLFEVPPEQVTPEMRRRAKTINFGIIYGMGAKKLSGDLKISFQDAKLFIDKYFEKYPGIKQFMDKTTEEAEKTGLIRTFYGRIRQVPDINSNNFQLKEAAKRIAINTPIQGTAADIMKLKMVHIYNQLGSLPYYAKLLLQVHDELVFEVDRGKEEAFADYLKKEMTIIPGFKLTLPISVAWGNNWKEAK